MCLRAEIDMEAQCDLELQVLIDIIELPARKKKSKNLHSKTGPRFGAPWKQ